MESNNLTNRTYTTPTCSLIVANKDRQSADEDRVDFQLHLDRPSNGTPDRATLQGSYQQLDYLQQMVGRYIAELVAKFPLASANTPAPPPNAPAPASDPAPTPIANPEPIDPDIDSPRSGIVKNLPGLRTNPSPTAPKNDAGIPSEDPPRSNMSKFLGRWQKQSEPANTPADLPIVGAAAPMSNHLEPSNLNGERIASPAATDRATDEPYLVSVGERALDHQLHLGKIETTSADKILTLSAIELFDLATVLDEYANERGDVARPQTAPNPRIPNPIYGNRTAAVGGTAAAAHPNLPNLPRIPAESEIDRAYYRNRHSQSSFMSAIPWAIAAAIAVSIPLLLLERQSNPLKELTSKLGFPGQTTAKKPGKAVAPTTPPTATNPIAVLPTTPNVTTPPQWQEQPVTPPAVKTNPLDPNKIATGDPNKIGVTTLPDTLIGKSPTAPNPLDIVPSSGNPTQPLDPRQSAVSNATTPNLNPQKSTVTAKTNSVSAVAKNPAIATNKPSAAKTVPTQIGELPIDAPKSGKISVSQQPMPSAAVPPIDNTPTTPIPFNPPDIANEEAANVSSPIPKKAVKPTSTSTKPSIKTAKSPANSPAPLQPVEPFTPIPRNPNLINPEAPENSSSPPTAAPAPLQSNNNLPVSGAEPTANISLGESKRYFQGKWKADATQPSALQYVIQVSGKNGIVKGVDPQGEAATSYLQQSKFIKPGQKLLSPAAAGSTDQKIRVLLQPDGNVDTFIEP